MNALTVALSNALKDQPGRTISFRQFSNIGVLMTVRDRDDDKIAQVEKCWTNLQLETSGVDPILMDLERALAELAATKAKP